MQIDSIDNFLFYGKNNLSDEIKADVYWALLQPGRSMVYYRSGVPGVPDYENYPLGYMFKIILPYLVTTWMGKRNNEVSDGTNGTVDRRAITSQSVIQFIQKNDQIEMDVYYYMLSDLSSMQKISTPIGGIAQ